MTKTETEKNLEINYPHVEIPQYNSRISLILRSEAPIDTKTLTKKQREDLNSTTVIAGQAGRMCYTNSSPSPLDYNLKSNSYRETTDKISTQTREKGHSSTREHVHYTFKIDGISRNAIYYLHSHPHYVTDMQSQRYCNFSVTKPIVPELENPEIQQRVNDAAKDLVTGYNDLYKLLTPTTKELILERFPSRNNSKWEAKVNDEACKKSQEIARYLLPLGTPTNLYHTISELTLLRLYHQSQTMPVQPEMRQIIDGMVGTVAQVDLKILQEISQPLSQDIEPILQIEDFSKFADEYDSVLANYQIKLDDDNQLPSNKLARAVRETLGKSSQELPNEEALDLLLNPAKNKMLSETNGDITIDRLGQCLNQVSLSFLISLSHVANEQFHRHRTFDHTEQIQLSIPQKDSDIIVPTILEKNPEALNLYLSIQKRHNIVLQDLFDQGVALDKLQYLFTNATRVRKSVNAPLGAIYHFIKLRTCLTAQEEIYHIAVSLTQQILDLDPALAKYFQNPSPCGIRHQAGEKPLCPEGDRYCGVRVWDINIKDFPKRYI
ncbi:MAG TPA: FAD-dependent thymidylate synthase [Spirochaetia bacterium]|nr:FAD-dependent thymidylate synthase [Spirochaetia bacterium]